MAPSPSADWNQAAQRVLADFQLGPTCQTPQPLGSAGGFSGAMFWKVFVADGCHCLRRWPPTHPDRDQLRWIHAVLRHVGRTSSVGLPLPVATRTGDTFLEHAGHLWELTPWLPGAADYRLHPTPQRLAAAMEALADFHIAAATFDCGNPTLPNGVTTPVPRGRPALSQASPTGDPKVSPGLRQRRDFLRQLLGDEGRRLKSAVFRGRSPALDCRAGPVLLELERLGPSLLSQLDAVAEQRRALQPCIRDIWHAHVLLQGDTVSGIVDFGAMRLDTVCGDIARLLGSLVEDDEDGWQTGLEAYDRRRSLDVDQRELVRLFDRTGTLLGGLNWLRWIYLEGRDFDWPRVLQRLDETLARLRHQ